MPASLTDLLWEIYPFFYDSLNNFAPYKKMIRDTAESLNFSKGKKFLDVGCGTGNLIQYLVKNSKEIEVWGIDASEQALKIASKKIKNSNANVKLYKYYFEEKLPFNDNYFDGIAAVNFINYLSPSSLQNFVREARRILRKGGRLSLVYTSEVEYSKGKSGFKYSLKEKPKQTILSLPFCVVVGLMNIPMKLKVNLTPYSKTYVEKLLEENNFKILNTKTTYYSHSTLLTTSEKI
ncbi:MAG: class I SAM-dependent methyltransferase [Candidatus Aenigmatarchaeota archaeon]